jgi:hypothetical protein
VNIPDRETARTITWMTDQLLANGRHTLPPGLVAALRSHKEAFLIDCAIQPWAQPRHPARYNILAKQLTQDITQGRYKPGQRLPSAALLAGIYAEHPETAARALHILAIRGHITIEASHYYVLPPDYD